MVQVALGPDASGEKVSPPTLRPTLKGNSTKLSYLAFSKYLLKYQIPSSFNLMDSLLFFTLVLASSIMTERNKCFIFEEHRY